MKKIILIAVFIEMFAYGYSQPGVRFERTLTWKQVLAKAKTEHKSIFVDCYATWCAPCKQMDAKVYPVDTLGAFMNAHFINVKVQFDHTIHDNDTVKSWYADAANLEKEYTIRAYPTFLFFDANGKAVHKAIGGQSVSDFKKIALAALDPDMQYYTLLSHYKAGKLAYPAMLTLAKESKSFDDKTLSNEVASTYIREYLDKLSERELLTATNIIFIRSYPDLVDSKSRLFKLCFERPETVDSALHKKGYANKFVQDAIYNLEIAPAFKAATSKGGEPDWVSLSQQIDLKFGKQYVESEILSGKINWYQQQKDGKNFTHYLTIKTAKSLQKDSMTTAVAFSINNISWAIFEYDLDIADLKLALHWTENAQKLIGRPDALYMDTQANLLYKLGRKEESIQVETEAAKLAPKDTEIAEALKKMQAGLPTWPDKMP